MSDISLALLPGDHIPPPKEIEESKLGEQVADGVIAALSQRLPALSETDESVEETLVFSGNDHSKATENMEKHFLQH